MSYDLHLIPKSEGDPAEAYERLDEREPTADEERDLRRLVADLQAVDPDLDVNGSGAGKGFWLQIGYENERPVVIDIDGVTITMSWSYGADDPASALAAVEQYLTAMATSRTTRSWNGSTNPQGIDWRRSGSIETCKRACSTVSKVQRTSPHGGGVCSGGAEPTTPPNVRCSRRPASA